MKQTRSTGKHLCIDMTFQEPEMGGGRYRVMVQPFRRIELDVLSMAESLAVVYRVRGVLAGGA